MMIRSTADVARRLTPHSSSSRTDMHRSNRWILAALLTCPLLLLVYSLQAQSGARGHDSAAPGRRSAPSTLAGGLTTLYAADPLARTMNFTDGRYGSMIQDHMVKNAQSDLDFGAYMADGFTVGIEGGRYGTIIDLGAGAALGQRYGFEETVGGGQGFASIRFVDGEIHVLADYESQETQPLREAAQLVPTRTSSSAPVHMGHAYLVRLLDRHDKDFELVAKFLVVEFRPRESVTLRWQRLK